MMLPLLRAYELLDYVDGSIPAPPKILLVTEGDQAKEIPNPEYEKWLVEDQYALTCILIGVSTDIGAHLVGVVPAREAWTKLANLFDSEKVSQFDFLEEQWREIHKINLSMGDYLKEVQQLGTKLAIIGKPESPADVNYRILSGLGEEWEPLILSLAPTIATMITDNLSSLLLQQEARRNFRPARDSSGFAGILGSQPPSINMAAARSYSGVQGRGNTGRGSGYGRVSGQRGHASNFLGWRTQSLGRKTTILCIRSFQFRSLVLGFPGPVSSGQFSSLASTHGALSVFFSASHGPGPIRSLPSATHMGFHAGCTTPGHRLLLSGLDLLAHLIHVNYVIKWATLQPMFISSTKFSTPASKLCSRRFG